MAPLVGLGAELRATLEDLAAFGEKRAGSAAGAAAAEYIAERLARAGLMSVHADAFAFPRHDVAAAALAIEVDRAPLAMAFAELEGSGAGRVDAPVVHAGWATREQLADVDVAGRVALVDRNPIYHRSTQYYQCADAGAAAVLFASSAPENLPQVGSIRRTWEAMGPIPALSVGSANAHAVREALVSGVPVQARIAVEATVGRGVGRNVLGRLAGTTAHELVVGAHYDTWFTGACDNGAGVAALLALAERRARRPPARYAVTFVAWDGEELALYGGYQQLRRYALDGRRPLAVVDFETPSALGAQAYGLARSNHAPLEDAIVDVGLHELFALNVPMDLVAELFGGIIPTDIQGLYRAGTPAVATAVDAPYYHTAGDTPDKVDLGRLEETVSGFDRALDHLMTVPPERFGVRDPALWQAAVEVRAHGDDLVVDVVVRDAAARVQPGAFVDGVLFEDDFFARESVRLYTDAGGGARFVFAGRARATDDAPRFLHISAGVRWPLVELVQPI